MNYHPLGHDKLAEEQALPLLFVLTDEAMPPKNNAPDLTPVYPPKNPNILPIELLYNQCACRCLAAPAGKAAGPRLDPTGFGRDEAFPAHIITPKNVDQMWESGPGQTSDPNPHNDSLG